jgi:FeS assembly SUF system protein
MPNNINKKERIMAENQKKHTEEERQEIIRQVMYILQNTYDPEIPVDIYSLGLIYEMDVDENLNVKILMTLTAPNCPVADDLLMGIYEQLAGIKNVGTVDVNLTFDPPWTQDMMTEEAKLDLGWF